MLVLVRQGIVRSPFRTWWTAACPVQCSDSSDKLLLAVPDILVFGELAWMLNAKFLTLVYHLHSSPERPFWLRPPQPLMNHLYSVSTLTARSGSSWRVPSLFPFSLLQYSNVMLKRHHGLQSLLTAIKTCLSFSLSRALFSSGVWVPCWCSVGEQAPD